MSLNWYIFLKTNFINRNRNYYVLGYLDVPSSLFVPNAVRFAVFRNFAGLAIVVRLSPEVSLVKVCHMSSPQSVAAFVDKREVCQHLTHLIQDCRWWIPVLVYP